MNATMDRASPRSAPAAALPRRRLRAAWLRAVVAAWMLMPALALSATLPAPVVMVRHAEKASSTDADPSLSEAGRLRAEALASTLRHAGIVAILVSEFARTRETAAPLAAALGIEPRVVAAAGGLDGHVAALAAAVRSADGPVLVVGHSNTVPALLAVLAGDVLHGQPPLQIAETQFDRLFLLSPSARGTSLVEARYGTATP